ncbi:MAG: ESX-1 secretion-associated protein [Mycobacterium sp.]
MGDVYAAGVDVTALVAVSDRLDDVVVLIERAARTRLVFDGAVAGRAHVRQGAELRRAVDALLADLLMWARAAAETGAAVRVGAHRFRDADDAAAERIRR